MSEKSKKNNGEQQKEGGGGGEGKKKESGGGKGNSTVVFKVDLLHCDGCVLRVMKCIRSSEGVETVNIGDGLITVVGKVDPAKIRERVLKKTRKKVELVSPQGNKNGDGKEKGKGKENNNRNGNVKEEKKKELNDKNDGKKSDEKKKEKEPPVTTAVLKVPLHCEGCTQKIRKYVMKTKGYRDMKIDKQKDTVTVTGALDMKALAAVLKKHLKRDVQIVPPKKESEKKEEKKDNTGGGKSKSGGEKGKNNGGGGDNLEKTGGGDNKIEGNKMQMQMAYPYPYPYPYPYAYPVSVDQFHYNPYPYAFGSSHAPQFFSDENPNACSVM